LPADLLHMNEPSDSGQHRATTAAPTDSGDPERSWRSIDATLRRYFATRVADPQLRADLIQEVLLRVHQQGARLGEIEHLGAWLRRVAHNVTVDHHRRHRPLEPLDAPLLPAPEQRPDDADPDPNQLLGTWVRARLGELSPEYRAAIELTELQGLSQRDAARVLSIPYSTLKSRVQRGRAQLHAALIQCCAVELDTRGKVLAFSPRPRGPCGVGPCGAEPCDDC